jgi:hypothetical protein
MLKIKWEDQSLGTVADRVVAERLGVSVGTVNNARRRLGIKACRGHNKRHMANTKTKQNGLKAVSTFNKSEKSKHKKKSLFSFLVECVNQFLAGWDKASPVSNLKK